MVNKVKKQECLQAIESVDNILKDIHDAEIDSECRIELENAICTLMNLKSIIEEEQHD